jgi:hypothetical protein
MGNMNQQLKNRMRIVQVLAVVFYAALLSGVAYLAR